MAVESERVPLVTVRRGTAGQEHARARAVLGGQQEAFREPLHHLRRGEKALSLLPHVIDDLVVDSDIRLLRPEVLRWKLMHLYEGRRGLSGLGMARRNPGDPWEVPIPDAVKGCNGPRVSAVDRPGVGTNAKQGLSGGLGELKGGLRRRSNRCAEVLADSRAELDGRNLAAWRLVGLHDVTPGRSSKLTTRCRVSGEPRCRRHDAVPGSSVIGSASRSLTSMERVPLGEER